MNIRFMKQIITTLIAAIYLTHILIITKSTSTRMIVIPFLIFASSLLIKNICLMFNKNKIAKIFSKIYTITFFIYYFGFLVYWDYLAITRKEYVLLAFSLLAWTGGIFVVYRRYLELRNKTKR